jgi:hypothetical protein
VGRALDFLTEGTEATVRLVEALTKLFEASGLRSASGRVMVLCEVVLAAFLAVPLVMYLIHDLVVFIVLLFKHPEQAHQGDFHRMFFVYAFLLAVSLVFVFVRETLGTPTRRQRVRPPGK